MPFPGTDRDAYKKASKGKTPKQRSRIYYREKAKNERQLKQSEKPKLKKSIASSIIPSPLFKSTNYVPRIQHKQTSTVKTPHSTTHKVRPQTQPRISLKQELKKSNLISWDKSLDNLNNKIKDKIIDFTLDLIKDNANKQIEKIIDTYQTIEKYIKVAQKIYKVIIKIDETINKLSVKYEQQENNATSQTKYRNDYARHKSIYSKYDNISNLVLVDLQSLEVWHLGKNKKQANKLYKLVLKGKKFATSYLYNPTEKLINNNYSILTNWDKSKQLLLLTTNIEVVPFNKVTKQHAKNEGEGTKTLRYWRKIHKKFFIEELAEKGQSFSEETLIVCETFRVVRILK